MEVSYHFVLKEGGVVSGAEKDTASKASYSQNDQFCFLKSIERSDKQKHQTSGMVYFQQVSINSEKSHLYTTIKSHWNGPKCLCIEGETEMQV